MQDAAPPVEVDAAQRPDATPARDADAAPARDAAAPQDAAHALDAAPPSQLATFPFSLDAVQVVGAEPEDFLRLDGRDGVVLSAGARLRITWPGDFAVGVGHLALEAATWRREEGRLRVRVDGGPALEALVLSEGDAPMRFVRRADSTTTGFGLEHRPAPLPLEVRGPGPVVVEVEALDGGLVVFGGLLLDARAPSVETASGPLPPWPVETDEAARVLPVSPCAEPGCDDGDALTRQIADAPEGPLRVNLAAGRFHLRTPVQIARPNVFVLGAVDASGLSQSLLFWDPGVGGQRAAVDVHGGGPRGPERLVDGDLAAFARDLAVDLPAPLQTPWVRLVADDHLDVPAVCLNGRDVERFQRHTLHLARVLSQRARDAGGPGRVRLDRGIGVPLLADARPRVTEVDLLHGFRIADVAFEAACPEAFAERAPRAPACANSDVQDDDGLSLAWTRGAVVERVSLRGFGAFSSALRSTVETRVVGLRMDHPSNYGEGGRGYGLHAITAGRTLLRGADIFEARHAVVVDFGSSDTQLVDNDLRDTTLAVIDVHGEASRDTLVRGNRIGAGQTGVLIGGGGLEVHCNDGPRHHVESNVVRDAGSALGVANATRNVTIRGNDLEGGALLLTVAFDAGEVDVVGNRFGPTGGAAVLVTNGSGPVDVTRNLFVEVCSALAAVVSVGGIGVTESENLFCPE